MDNFFLFRSAFLYRHFDKFIWLARDPRDSYISALEAGFAYGSSLYLPGKKVHGIDVGLLQRWKRIYRQYFQRKDRWHLIRYEDLVQDPDAVLHDLFTYLELTYEKVFPFKKFNLAAGGDPKLMKTSTIHQKSVQRYQGRLNGEQLGIFKEWLGDEMFALGYG